MINYSVDLRDIRFCLYELFHIQDLLHFERFSHLDQYQVDHVLTQVEKMAREVISPLNRLVDQNHPQYQDETVIMPKEFHSVFKKYADAGWISSTLEKLARGWGLPETVGMAIREIFNGACGGFYAFSSLTTGAMHLIQKFGTEAIKNQYVDNLAKGIYTGTMCLTEPESGSYLAEMRTGAKREGDIFKIKGTKIFIGTGDHDASKNIIHCVLARVEGAPQGYAGISLFIVPKYRLTEEGNFISNDVFCSGIENKMGWDGAPTARLHFGDNDDCNGWLLGKEGQGLTLMFQMMNELRLATAAQGVGQGAAAYQIALSFAKERIQGLSYKARKGEPSVQVPIINHPDIRRNLLFMKSMVEGCRRLILQTAIYDDLCKVMSEEGDREYYKDLVEILTPICKSYSTDAGFKIAETAIQSMGGYGYLKDFGVEQYLRDSKIACIYEGTNGIHGIGLQRLLAMKEGRLFKNLTREIDKLIQENRYNPVFGPSIKKLEDSKQIMVDLAGLLVSKRNEDLGLTLSVAKPYLDLTGHVLCTWMLIKSALTANALLNNSQLSSTDSTLSR